MPCFQLSAALPPPLHEGGWGQDSRVGVQSVSRCRSWKSVFQGMSPLRTQLLGSACCKNYLELWGFLSPMRAHCVKRHVLLSASYHSILMAYWGRFLCQCFILQLGN